MPAAPRTVITAIKRVTHRPSWWRVAAGVGAATVMLTGLTLLFVNVDIGVHRSTNLLAYLLVLVIAAGVGGVWAAAPTAVAATVLVDYFFTHPLYVINPLAPDMLVFIAGTIGVTVLTVFAVRGFTRPVPVKDVTRAVNHTLAETVGSRRWAAVYETPRGEMYAIAAPGEDTSDAAQQLADGAHGLTCRGCDRCSRVTV